MNATEKAIAQCAANADGEHSFEERGHASLCADGSLGVWWWECKCGLFVWHQRGSLERGILAGHFMNKQDAPKGFDLHA